MHAPRYLLSCLLVVTMQTTSSFYRGDSMCNICMYYDLQTGVPEAP